MTDQNHNTRIDAKAPSFAANESMITPWGNITPRKPIAPERLKMALEEAHRMVALGRAKGLPDIMDQYNAMGC